MTKRKSKAQRGLVTQRIIYANRKYPPARNQELKVNLRRRTVIDADYTVGLVAVRRSLPLDEVMIVRIEMCWAPVPAASASPMASRW
ncbi:MAG: hypothetical protein ACRDTC_20010 [Pseudonocardiaceae bacterium]